MSISSSLNAGVAGLNANATRLASISDNIANSGTYGYKRSETDFLSLVINGQTSSTYTAGGVSTATTRLIDERGSIISTSNATDLAITGRGFLPVTTEASVLGKSEMPLLLTTTGSFRADENGYLTTESGLMLLGWPATADGTIPSYARDTTAGLQPVKVSVNQYVGNPTTALGLSVNLPSTDTKAGAAGESRDMTIEYYNNLGTSDSLSISFAPRVPTTGASNTWTMTIVDNGQEGLLVGEYEIAFNSDAATGGTIASVTELSTGLPYVPADGTITVTTANGPMTISLGLPGVSGGLTQLADTYSIGTTERDGSPIGNFSSVAIDENGFLRAIYDNGFSKVIYQIPVVDVPNPNGLTALSNQTYTVSSTSGGIFLWNAGEGPTGQISGYAREESSTDVASELTSLIQTQRAYSSNAKVIQTVDEMLQETTNIKR